MKRLLILALPLILSFAAPAFANDQAKSTQGMEQQAGQSKDQGTKGDEGKSQEGTKGDKDKSKDKSQSKDKGAQDQDSGS